MNSGSAFASSWSLVMYFFFFSVGNKPSLVGYAEVESANKISAFVFNWKQIGH